MHTLSFSASRSGLIEREDILLEVQTMNVIIAEVGFFLHQVNGKGLWGKTHEQAVSERN